MELLGLGGLSGEGSGGVQTFLCPGMELVGPCKPVKSPGKARKAACFTLGWCVIVNWVETEGLLFEEARGVFFLLLLLLNPPRCRGQEVLFGRFLVNINQKRKKNGEARVVDMDLM